MSKLTIEGFIIRAKEAHGDKYDYSLVEYIDSYTKVKIICPAHGVFEQRPNSHINDGAICPKCSNEERRKNKTSNTEEFIEKATTVHGNEYDYSLVEYKSATDKVKIICRKKDPDGNEHRVFEQRPSSHLYGAKCPKCADNLRNFKNRTTKEEFIERAKETHGDKYDYSLVEYSLEHPMVKIKCNEHGVFLQRMDSHSRGNGCPGCAKNNRSILQLSDSGGFIEKAKIVHGDKYDYSLVEYTKSQDKVKIICSEHGMFEQTANGHLCKKGCPKCGSNNISSQEDFIFDNINIESERSNRKVLGGKEIDILYPHHGIGIEINGVYWHSDGALAPKDSKYHLNKTNECESKGIQLLHFWDEEINTKPEIVLSVIKNKLGITENKIYARKCTIKDVNYKDARIFLDQNHMQGSGAIGSIRYGLYYADELVSLMTFGLSRFNKNYEYELIRFCNKLNTSVVGGASRLFKHSNLNSVVSYANKRWSDGGLYRTLGFTHLHDSKPNFIYTKGNKSYPRQKFQKHKQQDILKKFDPSLTAEQNMKNAGYNKVYDCGNMVFAYTK